MKKPNKAQSSFIVRLIEGQTTDIETFIAAIGIIVLSAIATAIGNLIFKQ